MDIEKINNSIKKIENKENRIFYYILDTKDQANASTSVIYSHVKNLNDLGYNAIILHEHDYKKPTWLNKEYANLPHLEIDGSTLKVSFDDILILPETATNVMEQTKKLPCKRIVFAQSWAFILGGLMPSLQWSYFGIQDVIVPQTPIKDYIELIFGNSNYKIEVIPPAINENIFKESSKPKKPIIAIHTRDQFSTLHIIKQFYLKFPSLKWITFKDLHGLNQDEFASSLQEACLAVWVDKLSGFGTFPVEAAKTNTPVIGILPDVVPEYADNQLIWSEDLLSIPNMIFQYLNLWLKDEDMGEIPDSINNLKKEYTVEEEINNLNEYYSKINKELISKGEELIKKFGDKQDGE